MASFAILPAAGRSTRMDEPKLLLPWAGGTVIESVLAAWRASRVSHTVVVVHPDDRQLADICRAHEVDVVLLDAPTPDMKASVAAGLKFVEERYQPAPADVWLLCPADTPTLGASTIDRVLTAYRPDDPAIVVPTFRGVRGHPLLLPWSHAAQVERLPEADGVRALLSNNRARLIEIGEPSVVEDMDTPDDYRQLADRYNRA